MADQETTSAAGLASAIAKHAERYGIDIAPLCTTLGISQQTFHDITGRIGTDRLCRLIEACAVISGDEAFGLKCSSIFTLGSTGPFGYGLMSAPDLGRMITFISDNIRFISEVETVRLATDERGTELAWTFAPTIAKRDQFVDMALALLFRHIRAMAKEKTDMIVVYMERPEPRNTAVFKSLLSRNIIFSHPNNTIFFPVSLHEIRNPKADANLFRMMDLLCRQMKPPDRETIDVITQVRHYLRMNTARNASGMSEIAAHFNVSRRTLQRRLAEAGCNLQQLKDEERRKLAFRLTTSTELSFSEIAYRLGYSAQSAFTRSFIRWFSASPSQIRENAGKPTA